MNWHVITALCSEQKDPNITEQKGSKGQLSLPPIRFLLQPVPRYIKE
jgi:hypothetical protein